MAPGATKRSGRKVFRGAVLSDKQKTMAPFDDCDKIIKIFAEMIKGSQAYRFQYLEGRL